MDANNIDELLARIWPDQGENTEKRLMASICKLSVLPNIAEEELIKGAQTIKLTFKPNMPSDDDSYWLGQSPFNKKWYTFAATIGAGFSSEPTYVDDEYPKRFDDGTWI